MYSGPLTSMGAWLQTISVSDLQGIDEIGQEPWELGWRPDTKAFLGFMGFALLLGIP